MLVPFRAIDKELFEHGLPNPSFLIDPFLSFGAKFGKEQRLAVLDRDWVPAWKAHVATECFEGAKDPDRDNRGIGLNDCEANA